jgi:hypothetical protein
MEISLSLWSYDFPVAAGRIVPSRACFNTRLLDCWQGVLETAPTTGGQSIALRVAVDDLAAGLRRGRTGTFRSIVCFDEPPSRRRTAR